MTFKPGDLVIVIHIDGVVYPDAAQPGTIGQIVHACSCPFGVTLQAMVGGAFYRVEFPTERICFNSQLLRKLDGDNRKVVPWEHCVWRPERLREAA